jgi:hypothetical protein
MQIDSVMKKLSEKFVDESQNNAQDNREQYRAAKRKIETEVLFFDADVERQVAEPSEPSTGSRSLRQHHEEANQSNGHSKKNEHFAQ